jgi:hypothetical protein
MMVHPVWAGDGPDDLQEPTDTTRHRSRTRRRRRSYISARPAGPRRDDEGGSAGGKPNSDGGARSGPSPGAKRRANDEESTPDATSAVDKAVVGIPSSRSARLHEGEAGALGGKRHDQGRLAQPDVLRGILAWRNLGLILRAPRRGLPPERATWTSSLCGLCGLCGLSYCRRSGDTRGRASLAGRRPRRMSHRLGGPCRGLRRLESSTALPPRRPPALRYAAGDQRRVQQRF